MRCIRHRSAAFTLVEILMVIVIIGIAGAIVVPQMLNAGTLNVQAASRIIIADTIYAQNDAVARQATRRVVFDVANNSYKITDKNAATVPASWLPTGTYIVAFKGDSRFNGVTITKADFGGTATLEFDELGTPTSGGTIELIGSKTSYRITIAAFTGRITIAPLGN